MLDPTKQMELSIRLSPKTRWKAAARSIIIPGWGQRYADRKGKALLFHLLAAGSFAAYLITDSDFDDKYDRYDDLLQEYDAARNSGSSFDDLERLHSELLAAQDEAYDAENVRRIAIGSVVGVWALNLIDALFFFPEDKGTFSVKGLEIEPTTGTQSLGLKLTHRF